MLYHNQTAELRELLEFAHMYLQSDDEVNGPHPPGLGGDGNPLVLFLQPQLPAVSCYEAGKTHLSLICTCLLSVLRVLMPCLLTCLNLPSPGPSSGGISSKKSLLHVLALSSGLAVPIRTLCASLDLDLFSALVYLTTRLFLQPAS